jgi:outer membrane protein OmpA-like peptidoglycan-associated protein
MEYKMKHLLIFALITSISVIGCATPQNNKEKGTRVGVLAGAAAGALLGQAIGGDTAGTLIGAGVGAVAGGAIGRKVGSNMDEQEAAMRQQLAAVEAANVQRNADTLAVTFKADALFDIDSASLMSGSFDEIQRVSTVLNQYPQTSIIVAGHTDSTGSESHNLALSERRAMSVKNALAGQGVSLSRITTIGYGQATPIADNKTEAGRQLNRRVVVTIKPQQG